MLVILAISSGVKFDRHSRGFTSLGAASAVPFNSFSDFGSDWAAVSRLGSSGGSSGKRLSAVGKFEPASAESFAEGAMKLPFVPYRLLYQSGAERFEASRLGL